MLIAMGWSSFIGKASVKDSVLPMLYTFTLLGPSVAGLMMIAITEGKSGYKVFWKGLFSKGFVKQVIPIIIGPTILLSVLIFLSSFSDNYLSALFTVEKPFQTLAMSFSIGMIVGIFEEIGWTGYASRFLLEKYSVFKSGIVIGCVWGLWHMPLFLNIARHALEVNRTLYLLILLFSFLPAFRVLMVWLYDRAQSVFMVMMTHAGLSAAILFIPPENVEARSVIVYDTIFAIIIWIIVMLLLKKGKNVDA